MQEPTISERIMSILHSDYANPFSDNFNFKKIAEDAGKDLKDKEEEVLKFIIICNQYYTEIKKNITDVFVRLNLTKIEIIDLLHRAINKYFIEIKPKVLSQYIEENEGVGIRNVELSKFRQDDGSEIGMQQILEIGGDILNFLISVVNEWKFSKKLISPSINLGDDELWQYFNYIWFNANILLNIKSSYEVLIFENGDIESNLNFDEFKITTNLKLIKLLTQTADIRTHSNLSEVSYYLSGLYDKVYKEKLGAKHLTIENGFLDITKGIVKENMTKLSADANIFVRFYHFEKEKIKYFNNLTLMDINEVLILIVGFINSIPKKLNNNRIGFLSIYDTPSRINKRNLIHFLIECTDYKSVTIERIVSAISSTDKKPYLWRRPFYEIDNDLYFCLVTLNAPNYSLLIEELISEAGYTINDSENLLKNFIEKELSKDRIKYFFSKVDLNQMVGASIDLTNSLLYELNDYYILIEPICYNHPIESDEIDDVIKKIGNRTYNLEEKLAFISSKINDKGIIPLMISNHNTLSSLRINNITVFDFQLFKNYFFTGEYRNVQIAFNKNKKIEKEISKIEYYKDEKEFNSNFINFLLSPIPVVTIFQKIIWKKIQVTPDDINIKIIVDAIDQIDINDDVYSKLKVLDNALNNKYYYDHDKRKNELYDSSISYSLSNILISIAYGNYDLSKSKIELYRIVKKAKVEGFSHMIYALTNAISKISYAKIKKDKLFKLIEFELDEIFPFLDKIFKGRHNEIRLFDFKIKENLFTKSEEKKLISSALSVLSTLGPKSLADEDFESMFMQLAIIKAFKTKYSLDFEFYAVCNNMVDSLNFNGKFQRARNFCEEILMISKKEKKHHYGWGILFRCFTYQKNNFEAVIYGALYFTSLVRFTDFKYSIITDSLYNALKFFREFYPPMMDSVNATLDSIKLKKYDEQKFKLSYYLGRFQNLKSKPDIIDDSLEYLRSNLNEIMSFEENGMLPWLNYLYNLKRYKDSGVKEFDKKIEDIIELFEEKLEGKSYELIKRRHFGDIKENKENVIKLLNSVFETNSTTDFEFEIKHLELPVKLLLTNAIKGNDIEGILLSGLVLNDNTLTYDEKYFESNTITRATLKVSENIKQRLANYYEYIMSNLKLTKNQLFVWIFNHNDKFYLLGINDSTRTIFKELPYWDNNKMRTWVNQKESFFFDSKKYFDITEQEEKYQKTLDALSFSDLAIELKYDEILFSSSIDLTQFPSNLIIDKKDFISSKAPLTNVISIEWFIKNGASYFLHKDFSSTAWIPTEEGDIPINSSFSKLKPVLDNNGTKIIESRSLSNYIESDINIFLAHGEIGFNSFRAIYTSSSSESAILNEDALFGKGEIAILFICNSGFTNEDIFAKSVTSLCYDILRLGYKAVIAPFWRLEITIPPYWLDVFFNRFREGHKLSMAVHLANAELATYKNEISNAFFVPEGRLAMHLYGNPNLKIKLNDS